MTIDTIPPRSAGTPTLGPNGAALNRALARVTDAPLRLDNHLTLLRDGRDTYDDWLAAIGRARRWVHLENYIFKADTIGHRFAEALVERAAAGVAVRVLVDWFGSSTTPASFWERLRRAGVDVRTCILGSNASHSFIALVMEGWSSTMIKVVFIAWVF